MFKNIGLTLALLFASLLFLAATGAADDHQEDCYFTYDLHLWPGEVRFDYYCVKNSSCPVAMPCKETRVLDGGFRMCVCGGGDAGSSPDHCMTWVYTTLGGDRHICFKPSPCDIPGTICDEVKGTAAEMEGKLLCDCQ